MAIFEIGDKFDYDSRNIIKKDGTILDRKDFKIVKGLGVKATDGSVLLPNGSILANGKQIQTDGKEIALKETGLSEPFAPKFMFQLNEKVYGIDENGDFSEVKINEEEDNYSLKSIAESPLDKYDSVMQFFENAEYDSSRNAIKKTVINNGKLETTFIPLNPTFIGWTIIPGKGIQSPAPESLILLGDGTIVDLQFDKVISPSGAVSDVKLDKNGNYLIDLGQGADLVLTENGSLVSEDEVPGENASEKIEEIIVDPIEITKELVQAVPYIFDEVKESIEESFDPMENKTTHSVTTVARNEDNSQRINVSSQITVGGLQADEMFTLSNGMRMYRDANGKYQLEFPLSDNVKNFLSEDKLNSYKHVKIVGDNKCTLQVDKCYFTNSQGFHITTLGGEIKLDVNSVASILSFGKDPIEQTFIDQIDLTAKNPAGHNLNLSREFLTTVLTGANKKFKFCAYEQDSSADLSKINENQVINNIDINTLLALTNESNGVRTFKQVFSDNKNLELSTFNIGDIKDSKGQVVGHKNIVLAKINNKCFIHHDGHWERIYKTRGNQTFKLTDVVLDENGSKTYGLIIPCDGRKLYISSESSLDEINKFLNMSKEKKPIDSKDQLKDLIEVNPNKKATYTYETSIVSPLTPKLEINKRNPNEKGANNNVISKEKKAEEAVVKEPQLKAEQPAPKNNANVNDNDNDQTKDPKNDGNKKPKETDKPQDPTETKKDKPKKDEKKGNERWNVFSNACFYAMAIALIACMFLPAAAFVLQPIAVGFFATGAISKGIAWQGGFGPADSKKGKQPDDGKTNDDENSKEYTKYHELTKELNKVDVKIAGLEKELAELEKAHLGNSAEAKQKRKELEKEKQEQEKLSASVDKFLFGLKPDEIVGILGKKPNFEDIKDDTYRDSFIKDERLQNAIARSLFREKQGSKKSIYCIENLLPAERAMISEILNEYYQHYGVRFDSENQTYYNTHSALPDEFATTRKNVGSKNYKSYIKYLKNDATGLPVYFEHKYGVDNITLVNNVKSNLDIIERLKKKPELLPEEGNLLRVCQSQLDSVKSKIAEIYTNDITNGARAKYQNSNNTVNSNALDKTAEVLTEQLFNEFVEDVLNFNPISENINFLQKTIDQANGKDFAEMQINSLHNTLEKHGRDFTVGHKVKKTLQELVDYLPTVANLESNINKADKPLFPIIAEIIKQQDEKYGYENDPVLVKESLDYAVITTRDKQTWTPEEVKYVEEYEKRRDIRKEELGDFTNNLLEEHIKTQVDNVVNIVKKGFGLEGDVSVYEIEKDLKIVQTLSQKQTLSPEEQAQLDTANKNVLKVKNGLAVNFIDQALYIASSKTENKEHVQEIVKGLSEEFQEYANKGPVYNSLDPQILNKQLDEFVKFIKKPKLTSTTKNPVSVKRNAIAKRINDCENNKDFKEVEDTFKHEFNLDLDDQKSYADDLVKEAEARAKELEKETNDMFEEFFKEKDETDTVKEEDLYKFIQEKYKDKNISNVPSSNIVFAFAKKWAKDKKKDKKPMFARKDEKTSKYEPININEGAPQASNSHQKK